MSPSSFRPDVLAGKRILITGGGTGLGKELARQFSAQGAAVHICGRREAVPPTDAKRIENTLRAAGNDNVERHLLTQVNHHFQRDPIGARAGYDRLPEQSMVPAVSQTICSWARRVLGADSKN